MALGFNLAPDVSDDAVGRDEKSGALDAQDLFPVHVFLFEDIIEFGDISIGVGQQWVGERELFLELLLRFGCIRGDAQDGESGADE